MIPTKKILHVEAGRNLYGGALQVLYLMQGLDRAGYANILVCPADSRIMKAAGGIATKVIPVRIGGDFDLPFVWRLWRLIRREKPDIVHLHSRRGADTLGGVAARLAGAKTVLTRRVDNPESPLVVRFKYRLYDRVITISQAIRNVLIGEGLSPGKVACVHSAVDTKRYPGTCGYPAFRAELDIPDDHKVCAVIAQFIERKGHRFLLAAIPQVLASVPKVTFVFFGKGPLEDKLRRECALTNVSSVVRFAGFREDLDKLLGCLDVVVHPADMEGLGVSLLQAAASGVPIVGTAAGGIPEVVRDGVNGYLVPPRDPAALAEALATLLLDAGQARAFGAAGRKIVERDFSIKSMVDGNLQVYQSLL